MSYASRDILNRDGLRTMLRTYPVGIREIDAMAVLGKASPASMAALMTLRKLPLQSVTESWVDGELSSNHWHCWR